MTQTNNNVDFWMDNNPVLNTGLEATDFFNVNPYTDDFMSQLQGMLDNYLNNYQDTNSALFEAIDNVDPQAWIDSAMALAGGTAMNSMVENAMKPYRANADTYAQSAADKARKDVANSYAGGNLYSGSFGGAVGGAVGDVYAKSAMDEAGLQTQLSGSLMQQILQMVPNAFAQGSQMEISGLGNALGTQAGLVSNATNTAGGLAAPEYFNPYVSNPNYGNSQAMDLASLLVSALTGVGGLIGKGGGQPSGVDTIFSQVSGGGFVPQSPAPAFPQVPGVSSIPIPGSLFGGF